MEPTTVHPVNGATSDYMQLHPFLMSVAAPAAAKSVQAVVHTAQGLGQSFLHALSELRDPTQETEQAPAETDLSSQLANLADRFRSWLSQNGVTKPFELQFTLASDGEPMANVVGRESEKIIDLLFSADADWLEQFSQITQHAQAEANSLDFLSEQSVKLQVSSEASSLIRQPLPSQRSPH